MKCLGLKKRGSTIITRPTRISFWRLRIFFRTYADRCHHGKEEDILFRELQSKTLADEHLIILNELKGEHTIARTSVRSLADARQRLLRGKAKAAEEIQQVFGALTALYPAHIEKEDKRFFIPVMDYFSKKEQLDMVHRFWEFDERLIHRVYGDVVKRFE
ncbi:MAG: hemerythrin domain-containing protein [bacterium]|nr:hemerythrin domain-containing protein [bacterium]MDT8366352.1 hemerythrin domain-containing protein [bacterium]